MAYLSIIIPTKNEEKYLPHLLDSIERQTFKDYEIIIADDYSSDRTREIALERGCIVVEGGYPDIGRNNGAKISSPKSEVLCFIDSDIILPNENFLYLSLREMSRRNLDIAGVTLKPSFVGKFFKDLIYQTGFKFYNLILKASQYTRKPFMQSLMFASKDAFEAIGGFPPYEFAEDSAFAQKAVSFGLKFGVLTKAGKAIISPRRFEKNGIIRMMIKYTYFNIGRIFGHEFIRGKSRIKYW